MKGYKDAEKMRISPSFS